MDLANRLENIFHGEEMIVIYLLTTFFYVFANILLGFNLLKLIFRKNINEWSPVIILITGFMFGEGILASLLLFLSLTGYFKNYIIWLVLITIVLSGIPVWSSFKRLLMDTSNSIKSFNNGFKVLPPIWRLFLSIIILLIILFAIGSIVLPPLGDAEGFYMVLPKIMAYTGYLRPPHDFLSFSSIGLLGEFHFAALMVIADAAAAKFLVWFNALAVIGLLIYIGKLIGLKNKGQIIMLAILLTSSMFTNYLTDGKTDIFSAAFGLLTYYWLMQINKKRALALVLTGLFLGFAIVAKLSNAIVIIPGIILFLGWNSYLEIKSKNLLFWDLCKRSVMDFAVICFFALLSFSPTFIKNHFLFPGISSITASTNVGVWSQNIIQSSKVGILVWIKNILEPFIKFPFLLTFWEYPIKGNNMSILALAFLPLLFFRHHGNLIRKQIIFMVVTGLFVWIALRSTVVQPRYIISTLLIFIPIIALATENILTDNFFPILKKAILVSILTIFFLFLSVQLYLKFNPALIRGPHRQAMEFMNQTATPSQRVFLAGYYSYFLRPDLLTTLNVPLYNISKKGGPSPWEDIYNEGFNYVIVQKDDKPYWEYAESLPRDGLEIQKIYSDSLTDIYAINKK